MTASTFNEFLSVCTSLRPKTPPYVDRNTRSCWLLFSKEKRPPASHFLLSIRPYCESKVKRLVFWALVCESNCELVASFTVFLAVRKAMSAPRDEFVRSEERRVGKECRARWSTYREE